MANHIKAIKRNAARYLKNPVLKASINYTKYSKNTIVDDYSILIESYQGSKMTTSVDTLIETLLNFQNHQLYTVYIVLNNEFQKELKKVLTDIGYLNIIFVSYHSKEYVKALLKCKYLFTNFTLPTYFLKQNHQIITYNHEGIAFHKIGRHQESQPINRFDFQRTMLLSDYLIAQDQMTMDRIVDSFDLSSMYLGSYVIANQDVTYDRHIDHQRNDTKLNYHLILDWKHAAINHKLNDYTTSVLETLKEIDRLLHLEETLYVVLDRVFSPKLDFKQFKRIKPCYIYRDYSEEVAKSDGILCDYVIEGMYYHNINRKVVLYPFNQNNDNYYLDITKLPLKQVCNPTDALSLLRKDEVNMVKPLPFKSLAQIKLNAIIEHILFKRELRSNLIQDHVLELKKRKNVLLFAGDMNDSKLMEQLLEQLKQSNHKRYHYFILFYQKQGKRNSEFFNKLPEGVTLLPIYGRKTTTILEGFAQYFYFRYNYNKKWVTEALDTCYTREFNRISRGIHFDYAIHYSGLEKYMIWLLGKLNTSRTLLLQPYTNLSNKQKRKIHPLSFDYGCSNYEVVTVQEQCNLLGLDHYLSNDSINYIKTNKSDSIHTMFNQEQLMKIVEQEEPCYAVVGDDINAINSVISNNELYTTFIYLDNKDLYESLNEQYLDNDKIVIFYDPGHTLMHLDITDALILLDMNSLNYLSILAAMKFQVPMYSVFNAKSNELMNSGLGKTLSKRLRLNKVLAKVVKSKKVLISERKVNITIKIIEQFYLLFIRMCKKCLKKMRSVVVLILKKTAPIYSFIIPKNSKMILYVSFHGRGYSDNPKALHEYMIQNEEYKKYKHVWAIKGLKKKPLKIEGAKVIPYGGLRYLFALARSKYWISNCKLPEYVYKHNNQIYLQTWHGTPLKRLAYDIEVSNDTTFYRSEMSYKAMTDTYKNDVSKYNYMISPSSFTTEVFQSAFRINPEKLIETGYPRNDCLSHSHDIEQLKERFNLPKDKKVILYAPTWRDNSYTAKGYTFNLEVHFDLWKEVLGQEYIILFKPHYLIINNFDLDQYEGFVYSINPNIDISDLYIISDVLITDYSSVFFDYSILNRPTYFYMYDLENYKSELRGFYIDLYKDLPGDIYEEEKNMLLAIKQQKFDYTRLESFNQKFNNNEDGFASKRVLDIVFRNEN